MRKAEFQQCPVCKRDSIRKKPTIDDDIKYYHNLYWNAKKDMEKYKKKVVALKKRAGYIVRS